MDIKNNNNQIFFLLILYFFLPRFNISNPLHLVHLILGLYMVIVILINIKYNNFDLSGKLKNNKSFATIIIIGVSYSILIIISSIFKDSISLSNLLNSFKPVFFIIITIFSICVTDNKSWENIKYQLLSASKIFMICQSVISLLQLLNINIFDFIYISTKSFPFGSLVRVTGTLNNPNLLAWFTLQFLIVIVLLEKKKVKVIAFGILAITLIIFTGSRSILLITPFSLLVSILLLYKYIGKKRIPIFYILVTFLILLGMFVILLYVFKARVPYLAQLLDIFSGNSLRNISSFNKRFEIWDNAIMQLLDGGLKSILFGLDSKLFEAVDNDLLYSVIRYGLTGFILNTSIIIIMIRNLVSDRLELRIFVIEYCLFTIIIGMQAETFIGWIYPLVLYVLYGISLAKEKKEKF